MKAATKKKLERFIPALDEIIVYLSAVFGVMCAPVISSGALAGKKTSLQIEWTAFIIGLIVTAALVIVSELRGTRSAQKSNRAHLSRFALAFLLGLFWQLIVPLIQRSVVGIFSGRIGG